jgi:hypothetical protein
MRLRGRESYSRQSAEAGIGRAERGGVRRERRSRVVKKIEKNS